VVTLRTARLNIKQDRQCKYKVKLKLFHLTFIAVEKQQVLHLMSKGKPFPLQVRGAQMIPGS